MTAASFNYIDGAKHPIKAWTKGVYLEETALKQLYNVADLPFIHGNRRKGDRQ